MAARGDTRDESLSSLLALTIAPIPNKVLYYSPYTHPLWGQVCPLIHPVNHKHIQVILHVLYSQKGTKIDTKIDSMYSARTALLAFAANLGQSAHLKETDRHLSADAWRRLGLGPGTRQKGVQITFTLSHSQTNS